MRQGHFAEHWSDEQGNPAGGVSSGRGFTISWQNGPLGRHAAACNSGEPGCVVGCTRREPNGAFVEDVLAAVVGRIEFYQLSRFALAENADALEALYEAARRLDDRTRAREARAVEGTHEQ